MRRLGIITVICVAAGLAAAAPRQGGTAAPVTIEATADGARGLAILANNVGAYDDRYVKTEQGWRFQSRLVLTPQELAARNGR